MVASEYFSIWSQVKGQRSQKWPWCRGCLSLPLALIFHLLIQVWDGTEGLTQPAARQRPYSAVSIIQIPYLPWVLWDHHNAMSPSQKSIHTLRKMLFCKWKHCFTDVAQTRVIYTEHTYMPAKTHTHAHTQGKGAALSPFGIFRVNWILTGAECCLQLFTRKLEHTLSVL